MKEKEKHDIEHQINSHRTKQVYRYKHSKVVHFVRMKTDQKTKPVYLTLNIASFDLIGRIEITRSTTSPKKIKRK